MTYTFAVLELSPAAYAEIRAKLLAAGYGHAFDTVDGREVIDMHGIAVQAEEAPEMPQKTLGSVDVAGVRENVKDVKVVGNVDMFKLLCKASSQAEGWMKSTKAMEIPSVGCVVQVTTQQGDQVAEALVFVPGVCIIDDVDGGRKLVPSG